MDSPLISVCFLAIVSRVERDVLGLNSRLASAALGVCSGADKAVRNQTTSLQPDLWRILLRHEVLVGCHISSLLDLHKDMMEEIEPLPLFLRS